MHAAVQPGVTASPSAVCAAAQLFLERRAWRVALESAQPGVWGRGETALLSFSELSAKAMCGLGWTSLTGGGKAESRLQFLTSIWRFAISFWFSACLSQGDGTRIEYLLSSSASTFSAAVPKHENSCDDVAILLMVHTLVDTLHCPKICNHLIVIAILLYCYYGTSGGESYEHVISAERDNLLNLAKCHHFSKMNQNYFIMHVLLQYSAQIGGCGEGRANECLLCFSLQC